MIIKTLTMGSFQVNCYLVIDEATNQAVLIDAGGDYDMAVEAAKKHNAEIKVLLNTHGHMDHIAGDFDFQNKDGIKVYAHKEDEFLFKSIKEYLKMVGMPDYEEPKIDEYVEEGQEIVVGNLKFKVFHTPGHTPGGVCYLIEDKIFVGDTIFANSVGRTDLAGGSYDQLGQSIKNKLFALDENIEVFPGHGKTTTIGHEKRHNPFFGA